MIRFLRNFIACIGRTPLDRAECAIVRAANLTSECERERIKANYYTCMLLDIDPYKEWNLFAQIKQKEHDAQYAHTHLQERASKANIRAEALIEKLKEQPNEAFTVRDSIDAGSHLSVVPGSVTVGNNHFYDIGGVSRDRGTGEKRDGAPPIGPAG
jgi:hypothetical protein